MHGHRSYRRFWVGLLGLTLILVACGGTSTNSSTGTNNATSTPRSSNIPVGSTTTLSANVVSFTAAGGLTGSYKFSDKGATDNIETTTTGRELNISITDQGWTFVLGYTPYTGPGTYTASYNGGATSGGVSLTNADKTKIWRLIPPAACHLTIASDTPLNVGGTAYHEIKGSFSCPSLTSLLSSSPAPLTLSNGQFDVSANQL